MQWRVNAMGRFYDPGEGMVVYFDPAGGDTHLISAFAAHVVEKLADQPMDTAELTLQILPDLDPGVLPALQQALPDVLAELVALDILQHL